MDKKLFRSLILLITYTVLLIMLIVNRHDVGAVLKTVLGTLRPFIIGFAIAFILNRPCNFFARQYAKALPERGQKAARPLAVLTSYVLLLGLLAALISLVIPQLILSVQTFVSSLNVYSANLQALFDWVADKLDLESLANVDFTNLSDTLKNILNGFVNAMTTAVPQLVSATAGLISGVVTLFLAIVFSVYMLAGSQRLTIQCRRLIIAYLPGQTSTVVLRVLRLTADTFANFITGQITEACILGVLCFLGMTLLRFSYAPLISVIIAVSALIPVAGAYLGAILACLLLVMIDPMQAVWFLIFLVILQQLEGNIIYPRVVGTSLGLPGLWVLAAVTVGGGLFDFPGMLLGVPVTAVLYTLLRDDVRRRTSVKAGPVPSQGSGGTDGQNQPPKA